MRFKYDYKINFDSVVVGTTAVQYFEIKNGAKYPNWSVIQKPDFEEALNTFSLKKKVTKTNNNEKHEILIQYKPYQPFQVNVNYYLIKKINGKDLILKVKGYSEGVSVMSTVKYLNFYRLQNDFKTKTVFELHNKSISKIIFQFDIDNNQNIFNITPLLGEIQAGGYVFITVEFKIEQIGVFFFDQPILINFHQPIYIELLGVNSPKMAERKLKELRAQCSKSSLEYGFEKYMTESFGYYNAKCICNISPKYLELSLKNPNQSPELLNYTEKCIEIVWNNDKLVSIKPEKFSVRPNERCNFDVQFNANIVERLFGGQIYGSAFIFGGKKDKESPETIILPLSIRYISNTFCKTKNWMPSIELFPHVVLMPPCLQNKCVYSTFYIRRLGDYPVTFQFSPPSKQSYFRVKPMIGLIEGEFQIFVVKFNAGNANNAAFQEIWKIQLNQTHNVYINITFKAYVQDPKLVIGENDQIDFGTVFPGCKKIKIIPLINKTQNTIEFLFPENKWFSVYPSVGNIDSYGETKLTWTYTADCDIQDKNILRYEMRVIQEKQLLSGAPLMGQVEIFAKCAYGQLYASPSKHDFETVPCGTPTTTKFTMYNFSQVKLHFMLKCHESFGSSEEETVFLTPSKGSVEPGEHVTIEVLVLTYATGLSTYCIENRIRESEESDILVRSAGTTYPTHSLIFRIDYYSFYPTLKFIEIGRNVSGPLFGKLIVWEYCKMDKLNQLIRALKMNETISYKIRFPDAQANLGITKSVTFIVKNISRADTTCRIVRKKICTCGLKEKPNKGSFRKYNYEDCPHRKLFTVSTNSDTIEAYQTMLLKIEINYVLYGEQEVCFLMLLSHNRTVEIIVTMTGLRPRELSTYAHGFTLKMHSVFIGEQYPALQRYTFVNNTRLESFFNLDLKPLHAFNKKWGHNVLTCLESYGIVPEKSSYSIVFLFEPIAVGQFKIDLPFLFGEKKETLKIIGTALPYFTSPLEHIYFSELGKETVKLHDLFVNLSMEHIVIRSLTTHCSTKNIFVIKNVVASRTRVAFSFDSYCLKNTIKVWLTPNRGILNPGEGAALILHVNSGGVSSTLRVTLACHLVDYDILKTYLNSMAEYQAQTDQRGDLFCYGPDGVVRYPELPTVTVTRGPRLFHRTISITCNIVNHNDMDTKMIVPNQLKQTPFKSLPIYPPTKMKRYLICRKIQNIDLPIHCQGFDEETTRKREKKEKYLAKCTRKCCETFTSEEYIAIHMVLSCLLQDFIYCKKFKHYTQNITKVYEEEPRSYSEMKSEYLTPEEEKKQVELIVNRIPNMWLAETMQALLADCILRHFKLGQYPFNLEQNEENEITKEHSSRKNVYTEKFSFLLDDM